MTKPIKHITLIGQSLTRALTVEQINGNRSHGPMRRTATVGVIDEEARTVEVAFSSETPVPRWFGDEVLDHSPGAMSQERLSNGAPVLWNHNDNIQIGVVEESRIDGDRTGRAKLRFSKSGRAAEIWDDIVDGVIRHVSVGYFIRAIKTEEREGQRDKVTITEWEPYEISMTSVPADPTVGVGRSVGNPPEEPDPTIGNNDPSNDPNNPEGSLRMIKVVKHNGALVRAKVDANGNVLEVVETLQTAEELRSLSAQASSSDVRAEQQRAASLLQLGEQYSAQSLAANAIRDNTSVDEFTRSLLDHVQNGGGQRGNQPLDDNGDIGMSDDEIQNYSFVRAIHALCNPNDRAAQSAATFEIEASEAAARNTTRNVQGLMVPPDVLRRALNTSTSGASDGDTGGYAVATDLQTQSFIHQLRNRSVLLGMATPMGGLVGNVDIPGQASGGNAYWLGEDEEAQETTPELRMLGMSPKTLGAYTEASRRMFQQSSMDVEAWLRGELASAIALKVDHTGFYGAGTSKIPLGIKNIPGINAVPFAEIQPNWQEIVQLETEISSDNADVASMAYIGNSKFRGHCKSTEKFAGSSGRTIWESGNSVNGYRAEITNQVENGDVFHGNFADMVVASWGGLDLTVDPYSNSKQGRVRIVAFQDFDFAYRHVESFAFGKKAA